MTLSAVIGAYLAAGTLGGMIKVGNPPASDAVVDVYLLPGPIHTDFLLPATQDARAAFSFLSESGLYAGDPSVAWIVVGWGSEAFYTTTADYRDIRASTVWDAANGDKAVMRVMLAGAYAPTPDLSRLSLTPAQYDMLLSAITETFDGAMALDIAGLSETDLFFPAKGRFHLFRTCNAWVGEVLRAADVRVGIWTPFTWSLP